VKILINALSAKLGGIVTYTSNLARSLERRGIDFRIAVPERLSDLPNAVSFPASDYGPLRRFLWEQTVWRHYASRWRPDILFSSANYALLASPIAQVLLVREGGLFDPFYIRMIAPEQGAKIALLRQLRRRLIVTSMAMSDRTVVPSQALLDLISPHVPNTVSRCRAIPYGTILGNFTVRDRRSWRDDGVLRILYVGAYYPHKVPADLILAAEQLNETGIACRVRMTMDEAQIEATSGSSWDLFHIRRGVAKGLVELGSVPYADLPALYAAHDVFVFPSVSETFGHPMVEAMAAGIPVVAAGTAINREILGECAHYYTPLRFSELAETIRRLDAAPVERERLVAEGRRRAETRFDWETHVDQLLKTFEDVARRSR
jgi:glycosyltransferase involved in cell wall biosynthesis